MDLSNSQRERGIDREKRVQDCVEQGETNLEIKLKDAKRPKENETWGEGGGGSL